MEQEFSFVNKKNISIESKLPKGFVYFLQKIKQRNLFVNIIRNAQMINFWRQKILSSEKIRVATTIQQQSQRLETFLHAHMMMEKRRKEEKSKS